MKIPAKIEYAYKAILELAIRYKGDLPVQIHVISKAQNIPEKFLTHLLLQLKSANIVNSSRGVAGGYYLTRPPSRISLADLFKAIDDTIIGLPGKVRSTKGSQADKAIFNIWENISKSAEKQLEEVTFDKLITKIENEQLIYYI